MDIKSHLESSKKKEVLAESRYEALANQLPHLQLVIGLQENSIADCFTTFCKILEDCYVHCMQMMTTLMKKLALGNVFL